jgi:phosphatidylglycerol lysyltransferase
MNSPVSLNVQVSRNHFEPLVPLSREFVPREIGETAAAATPADLSFDRRLSLVRQYGTFTLAYTAAFDEGLQYFGSDDGFLAYKLVGCTALVLADPVSPPENREELIRMFVQAKSDVCFCQVSPPTAKLLADIGFKVNGMGTDTRIELTNYKRRILRRAFKRVADNGYVIRECAAASIGIDEIKAVSERWRQTRTYKGREVGFLNRSILLGDEVDVRKFYAFDPGGNLVAFSFYDPIYQDGRVVGYSTSFKRRIPEADPLIGSAILQSAIDAFRQEGRKWLHLGLSPMADIDDKEFKHSTFISFNLGHAYRCPLFNRFIYPLQGHATHKRDFGGLAEQTYFAFNTGLALPRVLKLLRACNMI